MPDAFFIAGSTLAANSASYLERAADRELLSALAAGEYCYVLDSRQKGKSSLMARALERLRSEGVACAKLELQRFGANRDPERWYASLLNAIGQDLGLTKQLFAYWGANQAFGPLLLGGEADHLLHLLLQARVGGEGWDELDAGLGAQAARREQCPRRHAEWLLERRANGDVRAPGRGHLILNHYAKGTCNDDRGDAGGLGELTQSATWLSRDE